ncbi:MAG: ACT domain-containing protein [Christensenella sp.]|uniref:ACT domain-containing protein n=1 Tax=Christensenella sp. TaxID=1935934 RepID=UPI002B20D90B|nr:ACT domain-containing protein [Christensenella sp.]MEA5002270.1 ACT domain-containing protein [Christensenella sp.]
MRAIVSVLGHDKPGIIAKVSNALYEVNANILDITQTVLRDEYFAMTMLIDLSALNASFEQLKKMLDGVGQEIGLEVRLMREEIFNSMHRI